MAWGENPFLTGAKAMGGAVKTVLTPGYSGPGSAGYASGQTAAGPSMATARNATGTLAATQGAENHAIQAGSDAQRQRELADIEAARLAREAATRQGNADAAGLDMMKPGINERFMSANGNNLLTGSPAGDFWSQYGSSMMQPGMTQSYAKDQLSRTPNLPDANLDAYYDRAEQNATTKLSAAQASRGAYGSSVGVGQVGSMLADLGAQRVKDQAQYGLDRSALDRSWMTARGDLASAADGDAVRRFAAAGSAAATADDAAVNRWKTTQQGAESAQGSARTRGQDFFTNNLNMGDRLSGVVGDSFEQGSVQDQGIFDAIIKLNLAKDAAGVAEVMAAMKGDEALAQKVMDAVKYMDTANNTEEPKK